MAFYGYTYDVSKCLPYPQFCQNVMKYEILSDEMAWRFASLPFASMPDGGCPFVHLSDEEARACAMLSLWRWRGRIRDSGALRACQSVSPACVLACFLSVVRLCRAACRVAGVGRTCFSLTFCCPFPAGREAPVSTKPVALGTVVPRFAVCRGVLCALPWTFVRTNAGFFAHRRMHLSALPGWVLRKESLK